MKTPKQFAAFGFLFGTVGLFVMSMFALVLQPFEWLSAPFMAPGRHLATQVMGSEGTDFEVLVLVLFNGLLYAGMFWAGAQIALNAHKMKFLKK